MRRRVGSARVWKVSSCVGMYIQYSAYTGRVKPRAELKKSEGRDLFIQGSSTIYPPLLAAGPIDRLILMTFPVLLGEGKRIFDGSQKPGALKLADHFVSNTAQSKTPRRSKSSSRRTASTGRLPPKRWCLPTKPRAVSRCTRSSTRSRAWPASSRSRAIAMRRSG